jgi:hypothetical protein
VLVEAVLPPARELPPVLMADELTVPPAGEPLVIPPLPALADELPPVVVLPPWATLASAFVVEMALLCLPGPEEQAGSPAVITAARSNVFMIRGVKNRADESRMAVTPKRVVPERSAYDQDKE